MSNFHVRNIPPPVYRALRARAKRNGRSINAEVIEVLEESVRREHDADDLIRRLHELRARVVLPRDAPVPEDLIRGARDERARRL
jgi:plasmid stability protein